MLETPRLSARELSVFIGELGRCIELRDLAGMLRTIESVVPEYVPGAELLEQAASWK